MERYLHQRCVRVIRALSGLADSAPDALVRADCHDAVGDLVDILADPEPDRLISLAAWSRRVGRLLDTGHAAADERLAYARLELLRMHAALEELTPKPETPAGAEVTKEPPDPATLRAGQKAVLEALADGPLRPNALVEKLGGRLSSRTIKRSLKELTTLGFLRRSKHEGQVEYSLKGISA